MDSDGFAGSIFILALVFFRAFLAICEAAIIEIPDSRVGGYENGKKAEKRLFAVMKDPAALTHIFSAGRGILTSAICVTSVAVFGGRAATMLVQLADMPYSVAYILTVIAVLAVDAVIILAFCCGLPKRIVTKKNAEETALRLSAGFRLLAAVISPFSVISAAIIRIFGGLSDSSEEVTEEEILMMVDAGNVEESQREMISNIFGFDDKNVSDIMTHRTDIVAVEMSAGITEVINASIGSGFSRIPVYEDTIDHIVGVISVKDLLCMIGSDAAQSTLAGDIMREVYYVPESMHCSELFKHFSQKKTVMAIAVDEYGGTAGIVTMEDLVETIVGDIRDEYDNEEEDIRQISDDTYTISGNASPEDIFDVLGLTLPEDSDFDTMSGFVISLLGHIPEENEHASVKYGNVLFTVLVAEDMWISKLKAEIEKDGTEKEDSSSADTDILKRKGEE